MLIVTELAEAMECVRKGQLHTRYIDGKPEGLGSELADVAIRLGDYAEEHQIDLTKETINKMDFNASRPHLHGGKLL